MAAILYLRFLGFAILTGLVIYAILRFFNIIPKARSCNRVSQPEACRRLIAGKELPQTRGNMLSPLIARALPNQRLREAFGIDNSFTSDDATYVKDFVDEAGRLLNINPEGWEDLSRLAERAVRSWVENDSRVPIKLTDMVQAVCLRVILHVLFGGIGKNAGEAQLVTLATRINRMWIASKDGPSPRFEDDHELQELLATVCPQKNHLHPRSNPLNLILPAFETLWRIVLRAIIEMHFTTGRHHPEWRQLFVDFAATPTKVQFEEKANEETGDPASVKFLTMEALRLYPPTRRVNRAYKTTVGDNGTYETVAADLEACQTSPDIWGKDAGEFHPERWNHLTRRQKSAFLAFGATPFTCPAKAVFGPRMTALLVGSFLTTIGDGRWRLSSDDKEARIDLAGGRRLCLHRRAYEGVVLLVDAK